MNPRVFVFLGDMAELAETVIKRVPHAAAAPHAFLTENLGPSTALSLSRTAVLAAFAEAITGAPLGAAARRCGCSGSAIIGYLLRRRNISLFLFAH